jgi:hypothetical protein
MPIRASALEFICRWWRVWKGIYNRSAINDWATEVRMKQGGLETLQVSKSRVLWGRICEGEDISMLNDRVAPNQIAPEQIVVDNALLDKYGKKLGPYGITVYLALARFAHEDAFPGYVAISECTGIAAEQVEREVEDLYQQRLIDVVPNYDQRGNEISKTYILLRIQP